MYLGGSYRFDSYIHFKACNKPNFIILEVHIMNNTVMDKNTLMDKMDELKELMGADTLLEELARALSVDDLRDNLEYIDRMHDMNVF